MCASFGREGVYIALINERRQGNERILTELALNHWKQLAASIARFHKAPMLRLRLPPMSLRIIPQR